MSLSTYYYDPMFEPLFNIPDLNRFFDAAWDARASSGRDVAHARRDEGPSTMRPKMDLHESKDKNEVTATFELPGMKKEDVNIDVQNNRLIVSGQSTLDSTLDKEGYALRERRFGRFSRAMPLPTGTKPEEVKACMENGVLTITFPKTQPEQEAKRITIA